jgi:hypothetical protein
MMLTIRTFLATAILCFTCIAPAATVTFVPPNDTSGSVFSSNSNDGWSGSRGIVFQVSGPNFVLTSVGLFQNLVETTLNYEVFQTTSATDDLSPGATLLRSGSDIVTTDGLDWIDFALDPLTLETGNFYHLRFSFEGDSLQNFFYNNENVAWSQDGFSSIDGTLNQDTGNSVVAAFRLGGDVSEVPEPSFFALIPGALLVGAYLRRRRTA